MRATFDDCADVPLTRTFFGGGGRYWTALHNGARGGHADFVRPRPNPSEFPAPTRFLASPLTPQIWVVWESHRLGAALTCVIPTELHSLAPAEFPAPAPTESHAPAPTEFSFPASSAQSSRIISDHLRSVLLGEVWRGCAEHARRTTATHFSFKIDNCHLAEFRNLLTAGPRSAAETSSRSNRRDGTAQREREPGINGLEPARFCA